MSLKKYFKNKNVLVTGGTGFIGTHFVEQLLKLDAKVVVPIHKRKSLIKHKNIKFIRADLEKLNDCIKITKKIDYIFHAAGMVTAAQVTNKNPMSAITTNLILTMRLLEASMKTQPKKILLFSSGTTGYPPFKHSVKESEMFLKDPADIYYGYGWSRRYTEIIGKFTSKKSKIDIAVCRPSAVYGIYDNFDPKTSHVIPALIKRAIDKDNPYIVWGSGNEQRDFMYAEDLIIGCLNLLKQTKGYEVTNIANGFSSSIKKVVKIILKEADYSKAKIIFDNSKPTTIPVRKMNIDKARRDLSFYPKTTLGEGLKKTIIWYRAHYTKKKKSS